MLEPLFGAELDYRPGMPPLTSDVIGSGDGAVHGPKLTGPRSRAGGTATRTARSRCSRSSPSTRRSARERPGDPGSPAGMNSSAAVLGRSPSGPGARAAALGRAADCSLAG